MTTLLRSENEDLKFMKEKEVFEEDLLKKSNICKKKKKKKRRKRSLGVPIERLLIQLLKLLLYGKWAHFGIFHRFMIRISSFSPW